MRNCRCSCPYKSYSKNNDEVSNNVFPDKYMYGHAYVPRTNTKVKDMYTPFNGLKNGSMFPELVSPYYPGKSIEDIEYLERRCNGGCKNGM